MFTISLPELNTKAARMRQFLEEQRINEVKDLGRLLKKSFDIDGVTKEKISVEMRPSESGTAAYTIRYTEEKIGMPLEVKINKDLDYSKIIVKGTFRLDGYAAWARDPRGNVAQAKTLDSSTISAVNSELKSLANYK